MKFRNLLIKNLFLVIVIFISTEILAQSVLQELEIIKEIPVLSVKSQDRTGTCWAFGTTSFIESELIRMGKGEIDLSEMFTVRCTYQDHAKAYIRYHGNLNFGAGAEGWDMLNVIANYGIVPQDAYPGLKVNPLIHDHSEMDKMLKAMVEVLIKSEKLSGVWDEAINGVLDAYLGEYPIEFEYKGIKYTPESFRDYLGIDVNNYQTFTSVNHHPYNSEIVFESPDNWSNGLVFNVALDDIISILNNSLLNGYSVVWASDVSDPGFNHEKGLAIVPEKKWEAMSEDEKTEIFENLVKQKEITPEMRQLGYNNYETTDDHLMHIVGLAKDKNGTKYYKVKNSWGNESNELGGFFYASESYVKLRTMTIMVYKDGVPKQILSKFKNQ
ncbi:MAG: aminopeptidase [Bacteroidales bacterium]|nr:aminopeptidase [Bacteroidales bacterium]